MNKKFSLYGINFKINYFDELDVLLDKYLNESEEINTIADVESEINKVKNFSKIAIKKTISNSLMILEDNSIIYQFSTNLRVRVFNFSHENANIKIEIKEYKLSLKRQIINFILLRKPNTFQLNDYMQAIRHALVFPYLLMMKEHYKVAISHGSAFSYKNKSYCIVGYDGIGKSTLVSTISKNAIIVSDNFVVYNDKNLFCVPEPLRIFGKGDNLIYGKSYIKLDNKNVKFNSPNFLFTYLGEKYFFGPNKFLTLKKLNTNFWNFLPEFQDLNRFIVALNLINEEIVNDNYNYNFSLFECERVELLDNEKAIDELQKL